MNLELHILKNSEFYEYSPVGSLDTYFIGINQNGEVTSQFTINEDRPELPPYHRHLQHIRHLLLHDVPFADSPGVRTIHNYPQVGIVYRPIYIVNFYHFTLEGCSKLTCREGQEGIYAIESKVNAADENVILDPLYFPVNFQYGRVMFVCITLKYSSQSYLNLPN